MLHSLSLADTTRLQTLIQILASEESSDLADLGHQYAMTHAASTLQSCSASRELMSGLTQVSGVSILFFSFILYICVCVHYVTTHYYGMMMMVMMFIMVFTEKSVYLCHTLIDVLARLMLLSLVCIDVL